MISSGTAANSARWSLRVSVHEFEAGTGHRKAGKSDTVV